MSTGTIALADSYAKTVPRELTAAASQTLVKLMTNSESPGLHVEPIQQSADPRIRSIRVNRQYRILAFHLPTGGKDHWVVNGVYDHDDAYRIARTLYLRINPIRSHRVPRRPRARLHLDRPDRRGLRLQAPCRGGGRTRAG